MNHRRFFSLVAFANLMFVPLSAQAQAQTSPAPGASSSSGSDTAPDKLTTERPGFTNGTDIVAMHRVQLETGYTFVHQSGADTHNLDDAAIFRVPFQSNLEARVNLPVYYLAGAGHSGSGVSSTGFGDFGVSAKWKFLTEEQGRRPALALIAGTSIPSGASALRARHAQPFADLEAQYSLSDQYQLQTTLLYARDDRYASGDGGSGTFGLLDGAISLSYTVTDSVGTFVQTQRLTTTDRGGASNATNLDGGFTYTIGRNVQLDISAGITTNAPSRSDHFYGAGFSERW